MPAWWQRAMQAATSGLGGSSMPTQPTKVRSVCREGADASGARTHPQPATCPALQADTRARGPNNLLLYVDLSFELDFDINSNFYHDIFPDRDHSLDLISPLI